MISKSVHQRPRRLNLHPLFSPLAVALLVNRVYLFRWRNMEVPGPELGLPTEDSEPGGWLS